MSSVSRSAPIVVVAAIGLLVGGACTGAASASPSASPPPSVAPSTAPNPSASAATSSSPDGYGSSGGYGAAEGYGSPEASGSSASSDYPLSVASGAVGSFLTGEDGKTLYIFKKDSAGSGKSVCNGQCATNWPPYTLEADETLAPGADVKGTITMITRDDGTTQVAYNGQPLYYFKGDSAAGDTNGQGVQNVWFVAAP